MHQNLGERKQFSIFSSVNLMVSDFLFVMKFAGSMLLLICILFPTAIFSQTPDNFTYRSVENNAWTVGENLKFKVYYESLLTGKVNAGTAEIDVKRSLRKFDNREAYHIIGTGKSNRAFDWFFKVRDRFESYVDKDALIPHHFVRRTREGGYVRDDDVDFDHKNCIATSRRKTKPITPNVQDIISAVYYARTLSADTLKVGDNISINFYLDDSLYVSVIQFQGREIVETDLGKFRCLAFKPMVVTGEVFSNPYPMTLWVTDDENKLPILAKSAVIVGAVKMELTGYAGLKNPVRSKLAGK